MEGVLRCVLTRLLGISAVVMLDMHWMEMGHLALVRHYIHSVCCVMSDLYACGGRKYRLSLFFNWVNYSVILIMQDVE